MHTPTSKHSLRRKCWPVQDTPAPDVASLAEGWMAVLDQKLQGWEVTDVLNIFEAQDTFFDDWHRSLGDTCAFRNFRSQAHLHSLCGAAVVLIPRTRSEAGTLSSIPMHLGTDVLTVWYGTGGCAAWSPSRGLATLP